MNGKSIADSILAGPGPSLPSEGSGPESSEPADEESAEDSALGATADLFMGAMESKDRRGVIDALRALVTMIRDGG